MEATTQEVRNNDSNRNMVTPHVDDMEAVGRFVVEKAHGTNPLSKKRMWGVSILFKTEDGDYYPIAQASIEDADLELPDDIESAPFHDEDEAREHFERMVERLEEVVKDE